MSGREPTTGGHVSPGPRRLLSGPIRYGVTLVVGALAVALLIIGVLGLVLLAAGVSSWLHPREVAAAWSRTLGGLGLIGGSAALAALLAPAVERVAGAGPAEPSSLRSRKFVAAIGILLALVCLPFAAAIHVSAHAPWLR